MEQLFEAKNSGHGGKFHWTVFCCSAVYRDRLKGLFLGCATHLRAQGRVTQPRKSLLNNLCMRLFIDLREGDDAGLLAEVQLARAEKVEDAVEVTRLAVEAILVEVGVVPKEKGSRT